ncbi:hypothetical protein DFH09DRAFT_1095237 [Mycena vulgaris]|nr:hypothetical protein DFH09DRAFT_1095237 [Mycena vulgaris]
MSVHLHSSRPTRTFGFTKDFFLSVSLPCTAFDWIHSRPSLNLFPKAHTVDLRGLSEGTQTEDDLNIELDAVVQQLCGLPVAIEVKFKRQKMFKGFEQKKEYIIACFDSLGGADDIDSSAGIRIFLKYHDRKRLQPSRSLLVIIKALGEDNRTGDSERISAGGGTTYTVTDGCPLVYVGSKSEVPTLLHPSNLEPIENTKLRLEYIGEASDVTQALLDVVIAGQSGHIAEAIQDAQRTRDAIKECKAAGAWPVTGWIKGVNQGNEVGFTYKGTMKAAVDEIYTDMAGERLGLHHIVILHASDYPFRTDRLARVSLLGLRWEYSLAFKDDFVASSLAAGALTGFVMGVVVGMVMDALIELICGACEVSEKNDWDEYTNTPIVYRVDIAT